MGCQALSRSKGCLMRAPGGEKTQPNPRDLSWCGDQQPARLISCTPCPRRLPCAEGSGHLPMKRRSLTPLALALIVFTFGALVPVSVAQQGEFPVAPGKGLTPDEAARAMSLPPGFKATAFAGEPAVHQPIAFTIDERGRLWVVENYAYPHWSPYGRDRILILEDTDGDGRHDTSKVFLRPAELRQRHRRRSWRGLGRQSALPAVHSRQEPRRRPTARRSPCSMAGERRTRTKPSTASSGDPMAGSTATRESSPIPTSANPGRATRTARPSTPASGATIRPKRSLRSSPRA
jgi:hypothetical protein